MAQNQSQWCEWCVNYLRSRVLIKPIQNRKQKDQNVYNANAHGITVSYPVCAFFLFKCCYFGPMFDSKLMLHYLHQSRHGLEASPLSSHMFPQSTLSMKRILLLVFLLFNNKWRSSLSQCRSLQTSSHRLGINVID